MKEEQDVIAADGVRRLESKESSDDAIYGAQVDGEDPISGIEMHIRPSDASDSEMLIF